MSQVVSALDLVYDRIITLLQKVTDEEIIEPFTEQLNEPDQQFFIDSITQLILEINKFEAYKAEKQIYADIEVVDNILRDILQRFPSYLSAIETYVKMTLEISKKIFTLLTDDYQDKDIDLASVEFFEIQTPTNIDNFLYVNDNNIDDYLLMFTKDSTPKFHDFLTETDFVNIFILFFLIANIDDTIASSKKYCLIGRTNYSDKQTAIVSFIELLSVGNGKVVHNTTEYVEPPQITSDLIYNIDNGYAQFSETIMILSEYNKEKGILEKYLKIYQVIENFMFRMPICELTNTASPKMFSIREFKRLYSNVDKNELEALKSLIQKVFNDINFSTGKKFGEFVLEKYNDLISDPTRDSQIQAILPQLGIKVDTVNLNTIPLFFTRLVYLLRNSIVHNKETEFHLSYANLPNIIIVLLKDFVIICLVEIIYNLIVNKNRLIWYDNQYIQLFQD